MKHKPLFALLACIIIFGCNKKDGNCPEVTITAPSAEVATLKSYLDAAGITAVEDDRGFFYTIASAGTGDYPTACSHVTVNYTGKLTNGITFDDGDNVSFSLSQLITGWQEGIPLIAEGGSITLYLPPSLAYGSAANGSIPANSNLIFIIDLKSVN
ncbi:MAG: FKBP-type peptidyl-prolyl cis-trans isomerase [Chitinophagales bacterium]|nr:FKBP-type peptidyl-prolyl cis-trans isomerase [Chitinophagales bacterium]